MTGLLLGLDIGSSSVKAALVDVDSGTVIAQATSPDSELEIMALKAGWAEQSPNVWWEHVCKAVASVKTQSKHGLTAVKGIGISYQMHGLVLVDENLKALRPAIIWCDSRAVPYGEKAFTAIGPEQCQKRFGNSPGNFTAAKLAWVKEHEPQLYAKIKYLMLPGDFIALKLSGEPSTSPGGLSEGVLWDYSREAPASLVLEALGLNPDFLPPLHDNFSVSSTVKADVARELGLPAGTPISYRAGDQPNNALALNVLEPGEVAANAGTSAVVYGVSRTLGVDAASRVNNFLHVNHTASEPRIGMLLCVNGAGSLYRWLRLNWGGQMDYTTMNSLSQTAPIGSRGLSVLPYGNGAERTLNNRNIGASFHGLELNLHSRSEMFRAAQEGIVFALNFGLEIMSGMGLHPSRVRAGDANMFKSKLFCETFASTTGVPVELFSADGAEGAARGAGIGLKIFSPQNAFKGLTRKAFIEPSLAHRDEYLTAYTRWKETLTRCLSN
jgi:xylulokinase